MVDIRKIGDISNSKFGPNSNFQGDNVKQINISENTELANALDKLAINIESISDVTQKDTAKIFYESLIESIKQNKPNRIERYLKTLKDILGTVASLTTIATQFKIVL